MTNLPRIIQIVGPTASGKTSFSVRLAQALDAELINVDSMQVYRPLAIGTDKPNAEQCALVPIHGINLIDFGPPMDASEFEKAVTKFSPLKKPPVYSMPRVQKTINASTGSSK